MLGIVHFRGLCLHFLSFCPSKNLDKKLHNYITKHTDVILVTETAQRLQRKATDTSLNASLAFIKDI